MTRGAKARRLDLRENRMAEKTVMLPKHSKLMAELQGTAVTLGTIGSHKKKFKTPPGVLSTIAGMPRLVAWFKDHQNEYEEFVASLTKPKAAKAAG